MKILAVTNMYPTPERPFFGTFIEQQVKGLREAGVEVEVLYADRRREGVRVYWTLRRAIREKMDRRAPDLVHVMYGGVMAKQVTREVRTRPVIVSFCGSDLLGENLPGLFRKMMVAAGVRASRLAAIKAAGIVVKSRNLYDALPKHIERDRIRVISNGIDLNRFRPMDSRSCQKQLGWDPDRFHVLFPANTGTPRKRLWLAQAALEKAEERGVACQLHLLQGVPHEDVPVWINASDVVLLTSEHEGSPNVIKESLACDVPVVSVDVGDVAERIEGIEGCFIAGAKPEDLADRLGRVWKGKRRVQGRSRISELSLERVSERLLSFYQETLDSWRSHGAQYGDGCRCATVPRAGTV